MLSHVLFHSLLHVQHQASDPRVWGVLGSGAVRWRLRLIAAGLSVLSVLSLRWLQEETNNLLDCTE